MAKGQLRGNREAKKPKQPKKLLPAVAEGAGAWPAASKTAVPSKPTKKK